MLLRDLAADVLICIPNYALIIAETARNLSIDPTTLPLSFGFFGGECRCRQGMHVQEDDFLVECLDPETLEPKRMGEASELVITALTKEAIPNYPLPHARHRAIKSRH
jgi:phenylacetate-CoA ligase